MNWLPWVIAGAPLLSQSVTGQTGLNYDRIADRIVESLALAPGERVILRYDPAYFHELTAPLASRIKAAGAVVMAEMEYLKPPASDQGRLAAALKSADVYLWMPLRDDVLYVSVAEQQALTDWLAQGGTHREIHFHWSGGSVLADGLAAKHPAAFDRIYEDALDIDYAGLQVRQDRLIAALRRGTLQIRTPEGTDLTLRVGDRPMNRQDGDASPARVRGAKMKVDREIELPAGVVRVAPEEATVNGTLIVPEARFGDAISRNIRFEIVSGEVKRFDAQENRAAVESALKEGGAAAFRFREIAIGVNPKLAVPPGSKVLPYYGYGDAVLRMSLGDNEELSGNVHGNWHRWFFFPKATVSSDAGVIVQDGRLALQ
jgi:hypothetical protein